MTGPEKAAARLFRDQQRRALAAANDSTPPDITVSVFVRQYRHDCPVRGPSVALELREHYVFSPAYHVCDCGDICCQAGGSLRECDTCGPVPLVPEKQFGFIFTEGRCGACGTTARSKTGRLVDAAARPPAPHSIVS